MFSHKLGELIMHNNFSTWAFLSISFSKHTKTKFQAHFNHDDTLVSFNESVMQFQSIEWPDREKHNLAASRQKKTAPLLTFNFVLFLSLDFQVFQGLTPGRVWCQPPPGGCLRGRGLGIHQAHENVQGSRMPQNPPWGPRLALLRVQARSSVPLSSRQQGSHAPVGDFACANRCAWCPRSGAHLWNRIHLCPARPSRSLCDRLQASSAVFKTNIQ